MTTYVLNIQNNTSMIGWISSITMDNGKWATNGALVANQPITAGGSVQGVAEAAIDTNTPLMNCSVTMQFGIGTAGPGSGAVGVHFGAQLVNRDVQPFIGALEGRSRLKAGVFLFPNQTAETNRASELYVGLVNIDVDPQL